jgi:hypothetical protein
VTKTVLVVGGRGQLELPVVRRLLQDGFRVRVLVRAPWRTDPPRLRTWSETLTTSTPYGEL